jgi:hypothetical protein
MEYFQKRKEAVPGSPDPAGGVSGCRGPIEKAEVEKAKKALREVEEATKRAWEKVMPKPKVSENVLRTVRGLAKEMAIASFIDNAHASGIPVTSKDVVLRTMRRVCADLSCRTTTALHCAHCGEPLQGPLGALHVRDCKILKERNLLSIHRLAAADGEAVYTGLVEIDPDGVPMCAVCGERDVGPEHFANGNGVIGCRTLSTVPQRMGWWAKINGWHVQQTRNGPRLSRS